MSVWEQNLDINIIQGDSEIAQDVQVKLTQGHTPGQQIVMVGRHEKIVYCADLMPTASHIHLPYIMAYDHHPLVTLEDKKEILTLALKKNWVLVFEHDPYIAACRLKESQGRIVPGEVVCPNCPD